MSDFSHSMKKRFSRATTRTKTLEAGMPSSYTSEKHAILREKATLERMLTLTTTARTAWVELARVHKSAAESVSGDAAVDGQFFEHANNALRGANALLSHASAPPPTSGPAVRIEDHVRAYLAELDAVEEKFSDVEAGYAEVARYERKVGKLSDRSTKYELSADKKAAAAATTDAKKIARSSAKAEKVADKARRNIEKLEGERAAYQSKLDGVVADMRQASAKYEVVLQCAHTAFWLLQKNAVDTLVKTSTPTTEYTTQVRDALVGIDVTQDIAGFDPEAEGKEQVQGGAIPAKGLSEGEAVEESVRAEQQLDEEEQEMDQATSIAATETTTTTTLTTTTTNTAGAVAAGSEEAGSGKVESIPKVEEPEVVDSGSGAGASEPVAVPAQ